jgi:hypothetical protein
LVITAFVHANASAARPRLRITKSSVTAADGAARVRSVPLLLTHCARRADERGKSTQ